MSFPLPVRKDGYPPRPTVVIGQNQDYAFAEISGVSDPMFIHRVAANLLTHGYNVKDIEPLRSPGGYSFTIAPSSPDCELPKEFSEAFKALVFQLC